MNFCLIHGSTKGETLVIFLMEVLDTYHNAVATLFDVCANSVKAL